MHGVASGVSARGPKPLAVADSYSPAAGGSGTLAYTAPESWEHDVKTGRLHTPDRATDQWALGEPCRSLAPGRPRADPPFTGLILHLLSFFTLPYHNEEDMALLEHEIRDYPGYARLASPTRRALR